MHGYKILPGLCLLLCCLSCERFRQERKATEMVRKWVGKEIVFPDSLPVKIQGRDTLCPDWSDQPYKIVVYIDSAECTDCNLRFYEWSKLIRETQEARLPVAFIFIAHMKDYAELEILAKRDRFTYPIWYDRHHEFGKRNHLPDDPKYQTLLLDEQNRVVLIGRPQRNPSLWQVYKKEIAAGNRHTTAELSVKEIDFGTFPYSKLQSRQVTLRNTGTAPLIIRKAESTCGCTRIEFPQSPVQAGNEASIRVYYEANGLGRFTKKITFFCNIPGEPPSLQIKGEVREDE